MSRIWHRGFKVRNLGDAFWMWLAWKLPRRLVYWAAIRLMAHATCGKWGSHPVPQVSIIDALNRWED